MIEVFYTEVDDIDELKDLFNKIKDFKKKKVKKCDCHMPSQEPIDPIKQGEEQMLENNTTYYIIKGLSKIKEYSKNPAEIEGALIPLMCRYPMVGINIALKEIALELDRKYRNHIREASELYAISSSTGEIFKVQEPVKNFSSAAYFRSYHDANIARTIVKNYLDAIFK